MGNAQRPLVSVQECNEASRHFLGISELSRAQAGKWACNGVVISSPPFYLVTAFPTFLYKAGCSQVASTITKGVEITMWAGKGHLNNDTDRILRIAAPRILTTTIQALNLETHPASIHQQVSRISDLCLLLDCDSGSDTIERA